MPDWLDSDSLIRSSNEAYRFAMVPGFWEFLEQKADEGVIASSERVLRELLDHGEDELKEWAQRQNTLFQTTDRAVQEMTRQIADSVNNNTRFARQHITRFLSGADPWLIAHAKVLGGRVVTFEKSEPNSRKPKIPDVGREFGVSCIKLWDLLTELNASF
ncbi:MAG: DUF4411 family protein [Chloroflexi bacterium]|nr:DUF4411 family protein [Chloroflexota bacterium]